MGEPVGPHLPAVTSVELDGRFCLFAPTTDSVLVLNESASAIWRLIDGRRSTVDLVDELLPLFDVPRDQLEADVRTTLASFVDSGLIDRPRQ